MISFIPMYSGLVLTFDISRSCHDCRCLGARL